jgi:hypothetical protein
MIAFGAGGGAGASAGGAAVAGGVASATRAASSAGGGVVAGGAAAAVVGGLVVTGLRGTSMNSSLPVDTEAALSGGAAGREARPTAAAVPTTSRASDRRRTWSWRGRPESMRKRTDRLSFPGSRFDEYNEGDGAE